MKFAEKRINVEPYTNKKPNSNAKFLIRKKELLKKRGKKNLKMELKLLLYFLIYN
jgi:hypothetical protein